MSEEGKRKPKILIVDDDVKLGRTLSDTLEGKGYTPLAVLTGKEGVAAIKEEDIFLALIDLKLPDMSGIEVLKEIKKKSPRTEAIILTGYASLDTAMEAVSLGAFSYLQKPYDMERLILDIHRALERRWAEEKIRTLAEIYSDLCDRSPIAIVNVYRDYHVDCTDRLLEWTGWSREEIEHINLVKESRFINASGNKVVLPPLVAAEMIEKTEKEYIPKLMRGETLEGVYQCYNRKDGGTVPLELNSVGYFGGKEPKPENFVHTISIFANITERKATEDALHAAYEKLKELDKLKTDFLNVAYHDLRSPLAPIVGYASLLEQDKLSEKQKKYVRIIEKSASQLEEMINRMLEVTRIETGKVELALEHVSIAEIVEEVLERTKPQVDAKKQAVSTVVPEGIEVEGDKQKITAIFDNLISNAIRYTGEKGRIDIMVEDRKDEGDIRVCVADTGAGIPEEQLPRIFERFYTVSTSSARKGGLGLGLAIVKGYTELHGGRVWVTSELGKGSKFWFTLPKRRR